MCQGRNRLMVFRLCKVGVSLRVCVVLYKNFKKNWGDLRLGQEEKQNKVGFFSCVGKYLQLKKNSCRFGVALVDTSINLRCAKGLPSVK